MFFRRRVGACALVALSGSACAHYGWADRDGGQHVQTPVHVRTVGVEASRGVDAAALTRVLVAELDRAGVSEVAWRTAADGAVALDCAVDLFESEGFGQHYVVRATAWCTLGEDGPRVERTASVQAAIDGERLHRTRASVNQSAAEEAISAAAPSLARALADRELRDVPRDEEDDG